MRYFHYRADSRRLRLTPSDSAIFCITKPLVGNANPETSKERCNILTDIKKIGIVGCGFVGSTIAYTLMESEMFNEMALVDANEAKARGEAMDMSHCLPFLSQMQIYQSSYAGLEGASIVVVAAGANQKEGETRLDLLHRNVKIFRDVISKIAEVNRECILLIVTNPVDILTYAALKISGFPSSRVIGSGTVLDTARLKYLVGDRLSVDSRNVHSFIIGEHGDSELAVWSSANVSGIDLESYCRISDSVNGMGDLYPLFDYVKNSAYSIIKDKGATYYAIAQSTKRIIKSIVSDDNSILPVSTLVNGHYGLDDMCLSIPAIVGREGVKQVLDIPLNEDENRRLKLSASTIGDYISHLELESSLSQTH